MENWLHKQADLKPNQLALIADNKQYSFAQLEQIVIERAQQLISILDKNPRVGVLTTNCLAGYVTILALQQLGRQLVLLNRRLAKPELEDQIEQAKLTQIVQDDAFDINLNGTQQFSFKNLSQLEGQPAEILADFNEDQVTSIMFTSGTTGRPKGVQQSFGNHFYSAMGSVLNLGLLPDDCWLAAVPIFHISGFSIMMRSLIYGIPVRLYDHFDAHQINADLLAGRGTIISLVPVMLEKMLADLPRNQSYPTSFRQVLLGGGPVRQETLVASQARGISITQCYGMTETASQIIALSPRDAQRKLGSVGKPLFPVSLRIVQQDGEGLGQLEVKAPNIAVGYLNQADKYQASFDDGWFKTGDLGWQDDEGFIYIKGRQGDMISSGGENVFPQEIEAVYRNLPEVEDIVVVGVPDTQWGRVPVALVKFKLDAFLSAADLRNYGREQLAHYKVPRDFVEYSNDWPRTASGKIQRYRLVTEYQNMKKAPQ
ncbi:o-succinylbenzoate--CoA ligase [Convivina praedatoris]|uniref:2-succinylbenzoate--CoA ligase n=1 Tax=Convivina praedatoris TaxID=2880963 RepID=A0ABM9D251_9LACO|nr:o-succinylbenzoate--CoA ligase [Convivina sp. LMG 32447]CAH1853749.1 2-succinylbenzoate--CoA ligase [Convivina sp. LMG 32447]CAH1854652.1 2-succinylbenzoate--CoA ligase [Convivina sp. LMG 32447]CAH1855210.1 2-succinylbenzoate--CoA ligase [Convivina sp. LMG 32447]